MRGPLTQALDEIDRHADAHDLPDIVQEEAAVITRRALRNDLDEMFDVPVLVSAAVYASSVRNEIEIPVTTLHENAGTVARAYQSLLSELNIQPPESTDPVLFLALFRSDIGVSPGVAQEAQQLLDNVDDPDGPNGHDPRVLAAGALKATDQRRNGDTRVSMERLTERTDAAAVTVLDAAREITGG